MILRESIQFKSGEIVYIQVNYIGLLKGCSFVITAIYPAAVYTVLDNNISKIAILANPTKKCLKFNKNIRLEIIYKCVDTVYIMMDIIKAFVAMITASSVFLDLFFTV